jgi:HEAT repeat protein
VTIPEIKLPDAKAVETKKVDVVTVPEVKAAEPKELPGKLISIVPAKTAEAPKPATVAPSEKANDAVVELAKKVTQAPAVADRHAAIRQIVKHDWKKNPMVASALVTGATSDKEPAVRVDCLRHMVAYKVTHPQVVTQVSTLCNDSDPWVRQEAVQALSLLKAMQ